VILRATWFTNVDEKFKYFADGMVKYGIPFGVYCYSYALDLLQARDERLALFDAIKGYKLDYPVYFDMEDADHYKERKGFPNDLTLVQMCADFCDYFEKKGYYASIYASKSWFDTHLKHDSLDKYDKWIAQWNSVCTYAKPYGTWQFTSKFRLDGYNGNLDCSYAYYDYPKIMRDKGLNGYTKQEDDIVVIPNEDFEMLYNVERKKNQQLNEEYSQLEDDILALTLTNDNLVSVNEDIIEDMIAIQEIVKKY
jgi:GH25 family lysozyme M1 (1,4-beta-N-acetylmuramidase)